MLTIQQLETALVFLGRADLKGNEVQAFVDLSNALNAARAQLISAQFPAPSAAPEAQAEPRRRRSTNQQE